MTMKWIDELEQYEVGDKAFLIEFYNEGNGSTRYTLRDRPAYTNQSNEPRLTGWCGTYNNVSTTGDGAWKVVRIAKSGRYLIQELEGSELVDYLDEMGYPELVP
jgi:hypothetical protein